MPAWSPLMSDFDEIEKAFVSERGPLAACPPLAMLHAHGQSVLPVETEARVGAHIASCALCQMLLRDLSSLEEQNLTQAAKNRIHSSIPVPGQRSAPGPLHWSILSAVAAGLAIIAFFLYTGRNHRQPTQLTAVSAPQPAAQFHLQITKLPPPPTTGPDLVFRGAISTADPDATELAPAFAAYNNNDYALAATRFASLAPRFPKSDIPILYLGVSQLLAGDNSAALASLTQADAIAKPNRKDAASWYHAVAAALAHSPSAATLLQSLCSRNNSTYAQQACSLSSKSESNPAP
jgi:hypothetical protein